MGVVPPADGFLPGLRELCDAPRRAADLRRSDLGIPRLRGRSAGRSSGSRRISPASARSSAAGFPVGAYGGRADIMELVSPAGPVYQAGTLSGNPVAMTAGLWAPQATARRGSTGTWRAAHRALAAGLADAARDAGVPLQVNAFGSLLTPFFTASPVRDYRLRARRPTRCAYATFFRGMLARGVYPPPSQFEAWFLSAAHTDAHVRQTIARRAAAP